MLQLLHSKTKTQDMKQLSYPESLEAEAVATFDSANHIKEVRSEDEWHALSAHAKEVLPVAQDVTEVDVKQVP